VSSSHGQAVVERRFEACLAVPPELWIAPHSDALPIEEPLETPRRMATLPIRRPNRIVKVPMERPCRTVPLPIERPHRVVKLPIERPRRTVKLPREPGSGWQGQASCSNSGWQGQASCSNSGWHGQASCSNSGWHGQASDPCLHSWLGRGPDAGGRAKQAVPTPGGTAKQAPRSGWHGQASRVSPRLGAWPWRGQVVPTAKPALGGTSRLV